MIRTPDWPEGLDEAAARYRKPRVRKAPWFQRADLAEVAAKMRAKYLNSGTGCKTRAEVVQSRAEGRQSAVGARMVEKNRRRWGQRA